ncbi:MAG: DoxX family protein [Bacteroidia bacterium]|nr:DoxX family protein [Bacteroidia bacterium]NNJ56004.1 DoxX family protein [Bacteroidia bacterium]
MNKHVLLKIGRILLSFLFVFGAISKLISMPFFDGMVAELFLGENYFDNPKGMFWTQLLGRILVAAELVIGIALLQNKWFKKVVLPTTILTLILFTIHLFYEGFKQPNGFTEGNCGCFGDVLPMTNLESIIKNIIGLIIGAFLWIKFEKSNKFATWVSPTLIGLVTMFTLSFGIKSYDDKIDEGTPSIPLLYDSTDSAFKDSASSEINSRDTISTDVTTQPEDVKEVPQEPATNEPEENATPKAPKEKTKSELTIELLNTYAPRTKDQNLDLGTKLVCLFSMTCSHCQEVYKDICQMNSRGGMPTTYLINYGTDYEQNYFFNQAGNCKHPHSLITEYTDFKRMLEGNTYPRIILFKDGSIAKEWNVDTYEKAGFMTYFGIEEVKEEKEEGGLQLQGGGSPW